MENNFKDIENQLTEYFKNLKREPRSIILHTGVGGMDLFEEAVDESMGFERILIGYKIPRILKYLKINIKKNIAGKSYRLIKTNGKVF